MTKEEFDKLKDLAGNDTMEIVLDDGTSLWLNVAGSYAWEDDEHIFMAHANNRSNIDAVSQHIAPFEVKAVAFGKINIVNIYPSSVEALLKYVAGDPISLDRTLDDIKKEMAEDDLWKSHSAYGYTKKDPSYGKPTGNSVIVGRKI